jgi:hypothetical protein
LKRYVKSTDYVRNVLRKPSELEMGLSRKPFSIRTDLVASVGMIKEEKCSC